MYLAIDPARCTGCRICEVFCSFRKEGAVQPSRSRITVVRGKEAGAFVPFTCQQCSRPLCAEVCPVRAITRDAATQAMLVDEDRCLGCKMCVLACPFGGMAWEGGTGQADQVRPVRGRAGMRPHVPHRRDPVRARGARGGGPAAGRPGPAAGTAGAGRGAKCSLISASRASTCGWTSAAATAEDRELPVDWAEQYLGGNGIGARILWEEVGPEIDALDPREPAGHRARPPWRHADPQLGAARGRGQVAAHRHLWRRQRGRLSGARDQVRGLRSDRRPGAGAPARVPVRRGWQGGDPRRLRPLGQDHVGDRAGAAGRAGRPRREGGLHRSGRREPGALRLRHGLVRAQRGARRHGRGHGVQEPEGRGGARLWRRPAGGPASGSTTLPSGSTRPSAATSSIPASRATARPAWCR